LRELYSCGGIYWRLPSLTNFLFSHGCKSNYHPIPTMKAPCVNRVYIQYFKYLLAYCDRSVVFSGHSGFLHPDSHDITEILLKVVLNTINLNPNHRKQNNILLWCKQTCNVICVFMFNCSESCLYTILQISGQSFFFFYNWT
jgi:hypothetical protein